MYMRWFIAVVWVGDRCHSQKAKHPPALPQGCSNIVEQQMIGRALKGAVVHAIPPIAKGKHRRIKEDWKRVSAMNNNKEW